MSLIKYIVIAAGLALVLSGCASTTPRRGGGYYLDDGPGDHPPANLAAIPDAVPKVEPLKPAANRPYTALGKEYTPLASAKGYKEKGLASWYGRRYDGKPTSSGEIYDMYAMTAAHATLPIPCYVRVTNLKNGRSVVVRVIDRGPFHDGRIIDLSYTAAWKLDILKGVTQVEVVGIDPGSPTPAVAVPASTPSETVVAALAPITPAKASPAAVPTTAPPAAPSGNLYLQLGAFSSNTGADQVTRLVQERIGTGLPALQKVPAGDMIKVQMGPFASTAEAEQAAKKLESETGIHTFKVTR
ncbi:MAG: septal ring lytic transglycosylase RlpA family protein [Parasulfuritortus sp.]|nr:septal ring lytic transglycosylase RlpA family protein [Parasulfuritortus sp.]